MHSKEHFMVPQLATCIALSKIPRPPLFATGVMIRWNPVPTGSKHDGLSVAMLVYWREALIANHSTSWSFLYVPMIVGSKFALRRYIPTWTFPDMGENGENYLIHVNFTDRYMIWWIHMLLIGFFIGMIWGKIYAVKMCYHHGKKIYLFFLVTMFPNKPIQWIFPELNSKLNNFPPKKTHDSWQHVN